ncbi:MAG: aldehyde-activating protein, partial [Gammaproteobacteria bacterium]|nr:aldehyde-activating protein [Gammaproteobacteria bacterium]
MSEPTHHHSGQCHCGAISMDLWFTQAAEEMQVRSCQCEFCTRHGSLTVSAADGRALITIEPDQLASYRFGSNTAAFLMCRRCGCYVGVLMADGDQ